MRPKKTRLKEACVALAMKIYLREHPVSELGGEKAEVVHHIIHQSRSNYLRCNFRNFCSLTKKEHYKVHSCGHEGILMGELIKERGAKWFDDLVADSSKKVNDNLGYWEETMAKLQFIDKQQTEGRLS